MLPCSVFFVLLHRQLSTVITPEDKWNDNRGRGDLAKLFATSVASKAPHLKRSRSKQNPSLRTKARTLPAVLTPNGPAITLIYLFFFQVAPKFSTKLMCTAWFIPRHTSLEWNRFKIREMKVESLWTEYNTISRVEFLSMLQQGILVSIFPSLSVIQHKNYFTIHLTIFQKFPIINYKRASL